MPIHFQLRYGFQQALGWIRKSLEVNALGLASPMPASWNQIVAWLVRFDALRHAASLPERIGPLMAAAQISSAGSAKCSAARSRGHLMQSVGLAPATTPSAKLWPTPQ